MGGELDEGGLEVRGQLGYAHTGSRGRLGTKGAVGFSSRIKKQGGSWVARGKLGIGYWPWVEQAVSDSQGGTWVTRGKLGVGCWVHVCRQSTWVTGGHLGMGVGYLGTSPFLEDSGKLGFAHDVM